MDRLYSYRDQEGQALPLRKRFPTHVQSPDDLDSQPLFLRLPIYPDACRQLVLLLEAQALLALAQDATAVLAVPPDAACVVDYGDAPDVVLEVGPDAEATLDLEESC